MKRTRITLIAVASGVAGVVIGVTGIAQAANDGSTTTTSNTSPTTAQTTPGLPAPGERHGSRGTAITGANADQAKAAALRAVPGTAERVVQLADGSYVVDVTKADGSEVRVTLDKAFTVTGQQAGTGCGGQNGRLGGHGARATVVTGANADQAKAAALRAVPGTAERVVQLADGSYVVDVTKADGSEVLVTLDKAFKVTGQQAGRRGGADGGFGHGGPGGDHANGSNGGQTSNAALGA